MSRRILVPLLVMAWLAGPIASVIARDHNRAHRNYPVRSNSARQSRADTGQFPTPADTGVPAHWRPAHTRSRDLVVTRPGAVIQDILFFGAT